MTHHLALKLVLPTAFFGYAAAANMALVLGPTAALPSFAGMGQQAVTQEIDTLYRENLPHRDLAIRLIGAARYALLNEGRPGVAVGTGGVLFTDEEMRRPTQAPYAAALAEITRTAETLRAGGAELIVAPLPAKLDLMAAQSPDRALSEELRDVYDRLRADLAGRGIAVIDTRAALAALQQPFLATDTHWTPEGARAVAALIAARPGLGGSDEFEAAPGSEVRFAGDLVSYITSEEFAPLVGLAAERVIRYEARAVGAGQAAVLDLFGDAGAGESLDLVGTSYSANPNWSFAEALKLELHRDVINHAAEGQGPFVPMRDYLQARAPEEGAATVLWEIPVRYLLDPDLPGALVAAGKGAHVPEEGGT